MVHFHYIFKTRVQLSLIFKISLKNKVLVKNKVFIGLYIVTNISVYHKMSPNKYNPKIFIVHFFIAHLQGMI